MNKKLIPAWILGLVLVVVLGSLAGRRFLDWQVSRAHDEKVRGLETGESTSLRPGMSFPDEPISAANGQTVNTGEIRGSANLLLVFLSTHCDACASSLADWNDAYDSLPDDIRLIGIADAPIDEVTAYAQSSGLRFPVYADTEDIYGTKHDVDVVPTIVGIDTNGSIRFVHHGVRESLTLEKAVEGLRGKL